VKPGAGQQRSPGLHPSQFHALEVNPQEFDPALLVGTARKGPDARNAGPEEGGVEDFGAVPRQSMRLYQNREDEPDIAGARV
jgi:hypothetical protein